MMKRGVRLVLGLIALAVFVSMATILMLYLVISREPSVAQESVLVLRPRGELHEVLPDDVFGQFIRSDVTTVRGFVENLRKASRDPRITTVLLMPGALDLPFWAKVQELRDAVIEFRRAGKTVVAFLEYGGGREYYLASAADRVFLLPTSPLDLTGVASYEIFLRGTLDKIGAYPDFRHIGEYKTAVNQLTETSMTPAHREMSESLNRDMYEQLVRDIAASRKKTEPELRALLDEGPYLPEDALRVGLVDDLAYEDQLDDRAPQLKGSGDMRRVEDVEYRRVSSRSAGIRPRSRIAVVYAVGVIASGTSGIDPVNGAVAGSDTIVEQIRRIRDDDSVKAIVLRVDSPGGSSTASDVIWRELMITRDQNPSRPLIVSMSDLAASGGYYIAMPGQWIVAQPATLTGSIGIYTGKMVTSGTLGKLGITTETVKSGRNADMYSPLTPFSPEQRAKVDEYMQAFYDQFVEKAAEARHTTPERIDAIAQGRVWTGQQAKDVGLVDELGGLDAAIAVAKQRARIPADEDVDLVVYPPRRSFYEAFAEQFGGTSPGGTLRILLGDRDARAVAALTAPMRLFRRGEPLALMPFAFLR